MLRVERASVYFKARDGRTVHALDRVSLDIPDQGFVVALGASGCGKSTLLNAIAGFLPLSEGTITLGGRPIEKPGADRGVVFQKDTLLPWKSVLDNVALGMKFAGIGKSERRENHRTCCSWSVSVSSATPCPMSCPAACASGSALPGRSRQSRTSC
jgi:taurine transport system ATP-binding protein